MVVSGWDGVKDFRVGLFFSEVFMSVFNKLGFIILLLLSYNTAYSNDGALKDPITYQLICAKVGDIINGFSKSKGLNITSKEASSLYDKAIDTAKKRIKNKKFSVNQTTTKLKVSEEYVRKLNDRTLFDLYENCKSNIKPENSSLCNLTVTQKILFREKFCEKTSEYPSTKGLKNCQEKMIQKRSNDTALQITGARQCGYLRDAKYLEKVAFSEKGTVNAFYQCIDVDVDLVLIKEKAFDIAKRKIKSCGRKQKKHIGERLPELIRMADESIKQEAILIKRLGIK